MKKPSKALKSTVGYHVPTFIATTNRILSLKVDDSDSPLRFQVHELSLVGPSPLLSSLDKSNPTHVMMDKMENRMIHAHLHILLYNWIGPSI